jgi:hypothetical protein
MLGRFRKPRVPAIVVTAYVGGRLHFTCPETLVQGDQELQVALAGEALLLEARVEEYFSHDSSYTAVVLGPPDAHSQLAQHFGPVDQARTALDRRRAERVSKVFRVDLTDPKVPAVVIDLSHSGLRLGVSEPLEVGRGVSVRMEVEGIPLTVSGVVRWCSRHDSGNHMLGVELAPLPPQLLGRYKRLLGEVPEEPEWPYYSDDSE